MVSVRDFVLTTGWKNDVQTSTRMRLSIQNRIMALVVINKKDKFSYLRFFQILNRRRWLLQAAWLFALLLLFCSNSHAHPISLSDAFVKVEKDKLLVKLEVFVEDLYLFHDLKLNKEMMLPISEVKRGAKLHEKFLQERFKIIDEQGNRLPLKFVERIDDDLPDFDIHMVHLMFFKLVYKYEVELKREPEYLTFLQEFTHEKVILPSEVLLKVKPLSGRREQKILLPNQPWTVRLNRDQDSDDAKLTPEQRIEKERSETLGITSYGQTYSFLYLEPEETRLEILIPLATIAGSLNLKLKPDGVLDLEEQQAMKKPIRKLIEEQIELSVDEKTLSPVLDRLDFFGVSFRDFSQRAAPKKVSIANARLGIILRYPRSSSDKTGELKWNLFNQYLYQANLAVIEGEKTIKKTLRKIEKQNIFTWQFPEAPDDSIEQEKNRKQLEILEVKFQPGSSPYEPGRWLLYFLYLVPFLVSLLVWKTQKKGAGFVSKKGFFNLFLFCFLFVLTNQFVVQMQAGLEKKIDETLEPQIQEAGFPQIAEVLLSEIYAAFNKRDEEQVFSRLEKVVDGKLLRTLYLEIRKSMTIEEQGGAVARAGTVKLISCTIAEIPEEKPDSFSETDPRENRVRYLECKWEVPGSVEHWGHLHQRTTSYLARLAIAPRRADDSVYRWKLTDIELLNQTQSVLKTSVREF